MQNFPYQEINFIEVAPEPEYSRSGNLMLLDDAS
jgi:hypothetical protein